MDEKMSRFEKLCVLLKHHGGGFDERVQILEGTFGAHVLAGESIPENTRVVSCPLSLVITQDVARNAFSILLAKSAKHLPTWSHRQWISSYLNFHYIIEQENHAIASACLVHSAYIDCLPGFHQLRTPLFFSGTELEMLKGTNLYGATLDREREWRSEWQQCHDFFAEINKNWSSSFTWERYLTANTHVSTRAFSSSLLSATPSLISEAAQGPILLPGVDLLNHAHAKPVSWVVNYPNEISMAATVEKIPFISLVVHSSIEAGQEIHNNYGSKPNAELILGYGFSLANNPYDTIVLKIGGIEGKRWEIARAAKGVESLWNEILCTVVHNPEMDSTYEDQLEGSGLLSEMAHDLLGRVPLQASGNGEVVRPDVVSMVDNYIEGQRDILQSLIHFAKEKERCAIEMARDLGVEIVLEE